MSSLTIPPAIVGRGFIRQSLDQGIHPATRQRLLEPWTTAPSATCGGCAFLTERIRHKGATRATYLKCRLKAQRRRGPDLQRDFPACTAYHAAPDANDNENPSPSDA
ncbi:hypothetical protein [Streptomyces klenkii]|uniref:hypothetical protein n=1 Tax=Streptomyces klenkii TaxID=1420899 RepID=UPI0034270CED